MKKRLCFKCGKPFNENELFSYVGSGGKVAYDYCETCLKERQDMDFFRDTVQSIFGADANWPLIIKFRNRLKKQYGYSDRLMGDCLAYLHNIEKAKITTNLSVINPRNIEKMKKYKRDHIAQLGAITAAASVEIKEYSVPIQKEKEKRIELLNIDDLLD